MLDDLVRNDVANIIGIGQLGECHSSYLGLLQISKRRPTTITCATPGRLTGGAEQPVIYFSESMEEEEE